jgi:hypothetical protein
MVRAAGLVVVLVVFIATACSDDAAPEDDPPRIVPWSSVGSAELGSTVERVREVYGEPVARQTLNLPVGTRYANRVVHTESYPVRRGSLVVTYVDDIVKAIETDSPRYRTGEGIGVGAAISRGPCQRNEYDSCEYVWRSPHGAFGFDECGNAWIRVPAPLEIEIGMDRDLRARPRGRIAWIRFGDLHVVLHCF